MDWFTTRLWLGTMACRLWTMASSSVGGWRTLLQPCHGTYTMPCPCSLLFMYLHSCPSHQLGLPSQIERREKAKADERAEADRAKLLQEAKSK